MENIENQQRKQRLMTSLWKSVEDQEVALIPDPFPNAILLKPSMFLSIRFQEKMSGSVSELKATLDQIKIHVWQS